MLASWPRSRALLLRPSRCVPRRAVNALDQEHPSAEIFGDYRDLLKRNDLDAVVVVLPSHLHFEVAHAVLESGRHLLLEKPMCLNVAALRGTDRRRRNAAESAGHRPRDAAFLVVGSRPGTGRRRRHRRAALRPHRTVAAAVSSRCRRLALRHHRVSATGFSKSRSISSIWHAGIFRGPPSRYRSMRGPTASAPTIRNCRIISAPSSTSPVAATRSSRSRSAAGSIIRWRSCPAPRAHCGHLVRRDGSDL